MNLNQETFYCSVEEIHWGRRLDLFLAQMTGMSRSRIQGLLAQGHVSQEGVVLSDASLKVRSGQIFVVRCPEPRSLVLTPEPMKLNIVFEDEHLVVINKPPHLVVHPGPGHETGTLVHGLLALCGETLSGIGGVKRPGIVHRLDQGTSGLMVVAKDDVTHQGLSAQFSDKTLFRVYHAFVWGVPCPYEGTISLPIGRHPRHRQKQAIVARGKPSVTHYRVLKVLEGGWISQVNCRLETGRTHQIRVHLQSLNHGLLGDPLYGRMPGNLPIALKEFMKTWPFNRPALHAQELSFTHPFSGETMHFTTSLPGDLESIYRVCQSLKQRM
jgi:23S rRNA pseudouridine1911/1915/1917 synthase